MQERGGKVGINIISRRYSKILRCVCVTVSIYNVTHVLRLNNMKITHIHIDGNAFDRLLPFSPFPFGRAFWEFSQVLCQWPHKQHNERHVVDLEQANKELRDDSDTQEQYSHRNCLLLHGVSEKQTDSNKAVLSVCNGKLGLQLMSDCIDRSHRLGHRHNGSSNGKPRPIIVKLKSYDVRQSIFGAKCKLKRYKTCDYRELDKTANGTVTESTHNRHGRLTDGLYAY